MIVEQATQKQEAVQSAMSYAVGGGSVLVAYLADIAGVAQSIAMILGCLVVAVRLAHDGMNFYKKHIKKHD